jgi:hypothetical protein
VRRGGGGRGRGSGRGVDKKFGEGKIS